jgi:(E)-4-hydroxy-3-methylbut-2-enyl-diphosphate synthase
VTRLPGDPFRPRRRPTFEVKVGDVAIGGASPIRVQSMTTTDTLDTAATADQAERLAAAGCEIVRITAPSLREAENLRAIRRELDRRGVRVPLVADIHFTPNAALVAVEHVEKVRVNPGNYADKKRFEVREYGDAEYRAEIERVAERFRPLVRRCRELGRALRIGTNHGSLSDRILNRYGDTAAGMVESALEFLDVCEDESFRDVVFSMKASNAQVAIQAYRLLAARLAARAGAAGPRSEPQASGVPGRSGDPARRAPERKAPGGSEPEASGLLAWGVPSYPFHLGVTEAGDGEDGRVKSAIGIGALLEDGIGDTIRVSLTEDPVKEVPVARALAARYEARFAKPEPVSSAPLAQAPFTPDPFAHARRASRTLPLGPLALGGQNPVRVEVDLGPLAPDPEAAAREIAASLGSAGEVACEGLLADAGGPRDAARARALAAALAAAGVGAPLSLRAALAEGPPAAPAARLVARIGEVAPRAAELEAFARAARERGVPLEWSFQTRAADLPAALGAALAASDAAGADAVLVSAEGSLPVHGARLLAARLAELGRPDLPIALRHRSDPLLADETAILHAATDLGAPLCDGIGDLVSLGGFGPPGRSLALAYRILQGARLRTSWTEYISCPSCGRTLFDLEETTARIKERTRHLRGVKIAVMGCIVNGPGEMADADFGYVGSGPGKVNLYVGRDCVVRGVAEATAPERLVELIRERGAWVEPS